MSKDVIKSAAVEGADAEIQEGAIYTFRKLNATDAFLMFKILSKIGVRDFADSIQGESIRSLVGGLGTDQQATAILGATVIFEIAGVILDNLPKCENEIYSMLSNTSNLSVDEVKALDFALFSQMVIDFIKKEEFKDFLKVVSKLFNKGN